MMCIYIFYIEKKMISHYVHGLYSYLNLNFMSTPTRSFGAQVNSFTTAAW